MNLDQKINLMAQIEKIIQIQQSGRSGKFDSLKLVKNKRARTMIKFNLSENNANIQSWKKPLEENSQII